MSIPVNRFQSRERLSTALWGTGRPRRSVLLLAVAAVTISACAASAPGPLDGLEAANSAPVAAAQPQPTKPVEARASYHFMRGYLAELSQDFDTAVREYQTSLNIDASSSFLKVRLAGLYFSMGDVAAAMRYAGQVRTEEVGDAQTLSHLAGIYAGAGERERALELYEMANRADPTRADVYFAKGLLLTNLKRFEEAEASFQEGLKESPSSPLAHFYLGRLALERRQPERAVASFERAIEANPSFEQAYLSLGAVYEAGHQVDRAIAVYRKYLTQVNPNGREIRQQLIRLYLQSRSYPEALHELEEMTALDPGDLDAQLRMSLIFGEMKEYQKAIEKLDAILKERPGELRVRDYQALMYEENKQFDEAIRAYEENVRRDPTYFDSRLHYGFLLYRQKRWQDAVVQLKEAVALNPKQPDGYLLLGLTYLQAEQFEPALRAFQEGIANHPANADLHFNLGTAYDKLNRFDDLVSAMEKALQLDPKHADALNYLGYSYAERGINIDEAVSLTQRAVSLKPNNGYYVDSLGWAFFKKGRLDEAMIELKKAVALVGDDPVIYEHLGEIYFMQNHRGEAKEAWLHSLELDPNNVKLLERFRDSGLNDASAEERIKQAKRKAQQSVAAPSHTSTTIAQ
ncbi:hypothetical protein YTPLAS18_29350 [Nitrospira sp.]|nr:hypothetical protein YTPLAS18_29350 [Nitrospira sp.]